jgi:hypothetical protein
MGEKIMPLVIGKSENPRCLRGMDKALLPVTYRWNSKAWMTSTLFREWLEKLNSKMKNQRRKILLFVDNCGAHPSVCFSNVKLAFLPPNTTAKLQPCDAGIIATLKAHYRKNLLRHILSEIDEANNATELSKRVNIKDAIGWVKTGWDSVSAETIIKCFAKCGFRQEVEESLDSENPELENEGISQYEPLLGDVVWQDYVSMDDETTITNIEDDEATESLKDSESNSESDGESDNIITTREALNYSKCLQNYAMKIGNVLLLEAANKLHSEVQNQKIKEAATATQTSIKDFFPKI